MYDDWPGVNFRVVARLCRLGADRMTAEDLASEAVTRALDKGVTFESADHLFNWTMLVARNLFVDQCRAACRGPEVCELGDHDVATPDTAIVVEQRMQVRRVLDALGRLSSADRAAVLTDLTPEDRREAVRLNVRRHRARARLRAALTALGGIVGLRRLPRLTVATTPVALATVVTACLPFVTPATGGGSGAAPAAAPRVATAAQVHVVRPAPAPAAARPAAPKPAARPAVQAAAEPVAPAPKPIARVEHGRAAVGAHEEQSRPGDSLVCAANTQLLVCLGEPVPVEPPRP